jgi:hypothetical protein
MGSLLKRAWIPLLIVVVLVIGGFTVYRIRGFFGADNAAGASTAKVDDTKPFNPKVVKYEIWGTGTYADINYLDLNAKPVRVDGASIPWSLELTTTAPSAFPNIVAMGDGNSITCRVTVDGEVKDERTSNGVTAQTFCLVKSA